MAMQPDYSVGEPPTSGMEELTASAGADPAAARERQTTEAAGEAAPSTAVEEPMRRRRANKMESLQCKLAHAQGKQMKLSGQISALLLETQGGHLACMKQQKLDKLWASFESSKVEVLQLQNNVETYAAALQAKEAAEAERKARSAEASGRADLFANGARLL
eukprot:3439493-Pleurochrysis_carterae.AAC.1